VTGNLCHWIDLAQYLVGAPDPTAVQLLRATESGQDYGVQISYQDGSLTSIVVSEHGNDIRGVQEYIEVRSGDLTARIDDFKDLIVHQRDGTSKRRRLLFRDKGHSRIYRAFWKAAAEEQWVPQYSAPELQRVAGLTYVLSEMTRRGLVAAKHVEDAWVAGGEVLLRDGAMADSVQEIGMAAVGSNP